MLFSICFQAEEKSFSATERISNLHQQIEDIQAELNRVSFTIMYLQRTYMIKMNVINSIINKNINDIHFTISEI